MSAFWVSQVKQPKPKPQAQGLTLEVVGMERHIALSAHPKAVRLRGIVPPPHHRVEPEVEESVVEV